MVLLKMQRRLAADILKCGKNRVWLDSKETSEIALATSRGRIKKLIKDGLVLKKNVVVHSRSTARQHLIEKRKGRHTGMGKRHGTRNARMPEKVLWMRRQRTLRRLLRKFREQGKIDRSLYHKFYLLSKGNMFKNKKVLIESIYKEKTEKLRTDKIESEQEARRKINLAKRAKKIVSRESKF